MNDGNDTKFISSPDSWILSMPASGDPEFRSIYVHAKYVNIIRIIDETGYVETTASEMSALIREKSGADTPLTTAPELVREIIESLKALLGIAWPGSTKDDNVIVDAQAIIVKAERAERQYKDARAAPR